MKSKLLVLSLLLCAFLMSPALAGYNMFMMTNTPSIQGGSVDPSHKDWIDLVSVKFIGKPGSSGPLVIQKNLDKASTKLAVACMDGTHFKDITIEIAVDKLLCKAKLADVTVTDISQCYSNLDPKAPVEELTLTYGSVNWEYSDVSVSPAIRNGWDNVRKRSM